ncbi:RNA polymerase II transcription factor B 52 kDa subunit [Coemansia sp. RSA 1200]|nr:RNA polymerase II transcription factor B 52 kDa subunit [Coemansia sp. RSA 1200]
MTSTSQQTLTTMGSEEEFRLTIAEYLESLPSQFIRRVFSNPAACLAIFRLLSTVGKQLIISMLYLDDPLGLHEMHQWAKPNHQRTVKAKIHQLRKLQILVEEERKKENGTAVVMVSLNSIFRSQLRNALTGGGDFGSFGILCRGPRDPRITQSWLTRYAAERWESILHFMVGQSADVAPPSESVRGILKMSRLMDEGKPTAHGENDNGGDREGGRGGLRITNSGFQFLLQDPVSQVWTVLLQYLRLAEMQDMDVVEVLNFLFQLVSLQPGQQYSTEALTRNQRRMLSELCDFGLLYLDGVAKRFYPTHLITSLTSGGSSAATAAGAKAPSTTSGTAAAVASTAAGGGGGEMAVPSEAGYIILETNCRIYAYTSSPLQIAILNLFAHLVDRFPNFVTGALTRESIRGAISHGITADQIITFLTTNAHPQMHGKMPVLPITVTDQVRLWERERNRLHPVHAHFYKDFNHKQEFERVFRYAQDIGVILWANTDKMQLVVTRAGHAKIVEIVRNQRSNTANTSASGAKPPLA